MANDKKQEPTKRAPRVTDTKRGTQDKDEMLIHAVLSIRDSLARIALAQETLVLSAMQSGPNPLLADRTFYQLMNVAAKHVLQSLHDRTETPEKAQQDDLLKQTSVLRMKLEEVEANLKRTST